MADRMGRLTCRRADSYIACNCNNCCNSKAYPGEKNLRNNSFLNSDFRLTDYFNENNHFIANTFIYTKALLISRIRILLRLKNCVLGIPLISMINNSSFSTLNPRMLTGIFFVRSERLTIVSWCVNDVTILNFYITLSGSRQPTFELN